MSSAATSTHFSPIAATAIARDWDSLYGFLLIASLISCILVIGGLIYFAAKYRRRSENDKTPYISHNAMLEFLWSFIPFVIFMVVFVWGWIIYYEFRKFPTDALEVAVQGQKWNWNFTYKSGRRVSSEFYVPVNENVKLIMTSKDVLHSFFIPAFRNKQDVIPGRYTALWFKAEREGDFQVFCTEYCGDQHSGMLGKVHVVSREAFDEWLSNDPYKGLEPAAIGQKIYQSRCVACHTLDTNVVVGPGWKGLFGKNGETESGEKYVADENYLRESIVNPQAKIVKGYANKMMTSFAGQLSEEELMGVIEFIKTLK